MSSATPTPLPTSVTAVVALNVLTAILEIGFFLVTMPGAVILGMVTLGALQLALSAAIWSLWIAVFVLALLRMVSALGVLYRSPRGRRLLIAVAATDALGHVGLGAFVAEVDLRWAVTVGAPALLDGVTIALLYTRSLRAALR